jgi:hypothetical protein
VPLITGAAITLLTTDKLQSRPLMVLAVSVFGFFVTLGLTNYNLRNTQYLYATRYRALQLEKQLELPEGGQFHDDPQRLHCLRFKISHGGGLALIYGVTLAAWIFLVTHSVLSIIELESSILVEEHAKFNDLVAVGVTIVSAIVFIWELNRLDHRARQNIGQKPRHKRDR